MLYVLMCRSEASQKIFTFQFKKPNYVAVAVALIQVLHKIKDYLWREAFSIIAKCGKTCPGVFFFKL